MPPDVHAMNVEFSGTVRQPTPIKYIYLKSIVFHRFSQQQNLTRINREREHGYGKAYGGWRVIKIMIRLPPSFSMNNKWFWCFLISMETWRRPNSHFTWTVNGSSIKYLPAVCRCTQSVLIAYSTFAVLMTPVALDSHSTSSTPTFTSQVLFNSVLATFLWGLVSSSRPYSRASVSRSQQERPANI